MQKQKLDTGLNDIKIFDKIQKNINAIFAGRILENWENENPQNMILWGSSGTGKTIQLREFLSVTFGVIHKPCGQIFLIFENCCHK